jgi:hypothetical protein
VEPTIRIAAAIELAPVQRLDQGELCQSLQGLVRQIRQVHLGSVPTVNGFVKFHWGKKPASISQPTSVAQSPIDKTNLPTQVLTNMPPRAPGLPNEVHDSIIEVIPDALQPISALVTSLTPDQQQAHQQVFALQRILEYSKHL